MSLLMVAADARHIPIADSAVQCVVTSPPYWGLRKYAGEQELVWGGTGVCVHEWVTDSTQFHKGQVPDGKWKNQTAVAEAGRATSRFCACGAWRGAYGLEPTIEMYVAHTVVILREIRRVLRQDGVVFWNIGDSYANDAKWGGSSGGKHVKELHGNTGIGWQKQTSGLKPKDICLIPARVALAAQADGWWLRSEIIWRKPSPMPESCLDRPTRSHEYVYMLTKAERYFYNWQDARDPLKSSSVARLVQDVDAQEGSPRGNGGAKTNGNMKASKFGGSRKSQINDQTRLASGNEWNQAADAGANWRDVWDIPHEGYTGAHFAVMPSELARRCIIAGSKAGDLVLDPFGGSGTTGRVAIELRRRCVLLDLAYGSDYGPLAKKRTTNVQLEAFA